MAWWIRGINCMVSWVHIQCVWVLEATSLVLSVRNSMELKILSIAVLSLIEHLWAMIDCRRGISHCGCTSKHALPTCNTGYFARSHNGIVQAPLLFHGLHFRHELSCCLLPSSLQVFVDYCLFHRISIAIEWLKYNPVITNTFGMSIKLFRLEIVSSFTIESKLTLTTEYEVLVICDLLS